MPGTPRLPHGLSDTGLDPHNGLLPPPSALTINKVAASSSKAGANMFPYDAPQNASVPFADPASSTDPMKMSAQLASTSRLPRTETSNGNLIKREHGVSTVVMAEARDIIFSTVFKTARTRAWEKSRHIDESEWAISEQELLDSLRPEEEGLVPLNAIAGRVVLYGWQLFANQVEINPSLSPLKRRKKIYDDAHEARKQLIKLLVLAQWARVAPELKLARSLIAFINDHFAQTDAAVTSLTQTRSMLINARLRTYDLATAIEVLGSGSPQRVPAILKGAAERQKSFSDREAINVVKALDEAIRLRLASSEVLPTAMASYTIFDGRACFRVPKLFETEVALSGSDVEDRWWLLRVKFDFRVTGSGTDQFPRQLKKQQRSQLLSAADVELAPRSVAAIAEQRRRENQTAGDVEMAEADDPLPTIDGGGMAERRDAPIVRLFNLLQSQALHYQLDILHFQVLQLIRLGWGPKLVGRMETVESTRVLRISYWQRSAVDVSDIWQPTKGGSLNITVQKKTGETGIEGVLKRLSPGSEAEDSEHGRSQKPERLHMQTHWEVQGPTKDFIESFLLTIDAHDLDAEKVLLEATRRHASAAIQAIKARLYSSSLMTTIEIKEIISSSGDGGQERRLLLSLSDEFSLIIRVEQKSGEIRFEGPPSKEIGNSEWRDRLREASTRVNERNGQIVSILQSLRSKALLENIEMKASLLGISFTTRMPLRQVDYASLQAKPGTLLYVTLAQCPGYYLVLHVGDEAVRVALMCAGTFVEDLQTSMRIVSLEWLDWQRVLSTSNGVRSSAGKRKRGATSSQKHRHYSLSKEDFMRLYSYSIALISYHNVEQQLRGKEIPFLHVGGWTKKRRPPLGNNTERLDRSESVADIVPSLCLDAGALLGPIRGQGRVRMVKRNISIQCRDWNDPSKMHAVFSVKLNAQSGLTADGVLVDTVREKIEYYGLSSVLAFSFRDISNCLALFVTSWEQIEKILTLTRELTEGDQANFFTQVQCDLTKVRFSYDDDTLSARYRWILDGDRTNGGFHHLSFGGVDNPHQVIRSTLIQWLRERDDRSGVVWNRLLTTLRRTLCILKHLVAISRDSSEQVESPELQVHNVEHYRLLFLEHYQLDIQLVQGQNILFSDQNGQVSSVPRVAATISEQGERDEFSLDSSRLRDEEQSTTATASNAIPGFASIVTDLRAEYDQEGKRGHLEKVDATDSSSSSALPLVFTNGLLCSNTGEVIDWIFPKLVERIQAAITL